MTDATFTTSVRIDATPDEVFPYLTDADLVTRWMGDYAELDPTPGGAYVLDINGVPIRGSFVEIEPPNRLVFSWGVPGHDTLPPGSTTVEIVLTSDGAGTIVQLSHHDLPPDELPKHDTGWGHFLARLIVAAPGGDPGPDPWANP
jgi:uncharacterized protein YndB with AHSA1/START domain